MPPKEADAGRAIFRLTVPVLQHLGSILATFPFNDASKKPNPYNLR